MEKNETRKTKEKVRLLEPKIDVVFQRLFNKDNEKITKAFVEALLEKKVNKIVINDDKQLLGETIKDKTGILDLELDIDNREKIDVEIQLVSKSSFSERLLFYFSKLYLKEIERGDDYQKSKRVVIIAILDYEYEYEKEIEEMETIWNLREKNHTEMILTKKIEIHIISLKKVKKEYSKNSTNTKAQWLMFLDDPNCKEVSKIMEENDNIKEAVVEVRKMSKDEIMQKIAFREQVARMDEKARNRYLMEERNGKAEWKSGIEKRNRTNYKKYVTKGKNN